MKKIYISIALLAIVLAIVIPSPDGLIKEGEIMFGILAMAVILWITNAIPIAATGILIMALQPLFGIMPAKDVFANFGNRAVFFILASFILAASMEKYGLHKRFALKLLRIFGKNGKTFIFGIMLTGAILSFIMLSHAVAILLLPILITILLSLKAIPKESNFGVASMLAMAYGTSIGSWGTLLGGARDPLSIAFLGEMGYNLTFVGWMKYALPVVFVALPVLFIIIIYMYPPEIKSIGHAIDILQKDISRKMKLKEKEVLLVYAITIILWIFFSSSIGIAVIALLASSALFLLNLVDWNDIERRVQWGIIMLYGGAITMGKSLATTGAASWLAGNIVPFFGDNKWLILFSVIFITIFLTNLMSNTAAVATMLPIGFEMLVSAGINPVIAVMSIAMAGGVSFVLIISTPSMAIAYSSGYISQKNLIKTGLISSIVCLILIMIFAFSYWQFL